MHPYDMMALNRTGVSFSAQKSPQFECEYTPYMRIVTERFSSSQSVSESAFSTRAADHSARSSCSFTIVPRPNSNDQPISVVSDLVPKLNSFGRGGISSGALVSNVMKRKLYKSMSIEVRLDGRSHKL